MRMVNLRRGTVPRLLVLAGWSLLGVYGCTAPQGDTIDSADPEGGATGGATGGGIGGVTGAATGGATGGSTGGATGGSTGAATGSGSGSSTGAGTGASTGSGAATGTTSVASGNNCVVPIPGDANVVDSASIASGNAENWWGCRNSVLSLTSDGHTAYVDRGDVVVNSINNTIYLNTGSDISIFTGPNNYVIESGYTLPTGTTTNLGTVTVCASITYDISGAPSPGC